MSIRALIVALVLVPGLVAGCVSRDEPEDETLAPASEPTPDASTPASTATPSPAPARPTPSPSPASSTSPAPATTTAPEANASAAPAGPETFLVEADFTAVLAASDAQEARVYAEGKPAMLELPRATPRNATLVATWASTSPADETLRIVLIDADGNRIGSDTGAGPLVIEIPGEAFLNATALEGHAVPVPSPAGPMVAPLLEVHFALSVTYA